MQTIPHLNEVLGLLSPHYVATRTGTKQKKKKKESIFLQLLQWASVKKIRY